MHLITPLLLLSGLGSALASPLLLPPSPRQSISVDPYSMSAGEFAEKNRNLNATCEADASDLIEQLVFQYSIYRFQLARKSALKGQGGHQCLNWHSDGCTKVPDKPFGCDFLPACQRHDFAWTNLSVRNAYTEDMKERVEGKFKKDLMQAAESKEFPPHKWACKGLAKGYDFGARKFSKNKAQHGGGGP